MSQERLFTGPNIAAVSSRAIPGISHRVALFTEDQLQADNLDDLAQDIANTIMGQALELHTGRHRIAPRVVRLQGDAQSPSCWSAGR